MRSTSAAKPEHQLEAAPSSLGSAARGTAMDCVLGTLFSASFFHLETSVADPTLDAGERRACISEAVCGESSP